MPAAQDEPTKRYLVTMPAVVSEQEWQAASEALLVKEKACTKALRRRLPMVRFGEYRFKGRPA
jgi:predicted dithiol-disulfide oxidoreductase (DUF899 family)